MPTAMCPECESDVFVDEDLERGDLVTCEECGTDLEVLALDPPEVRLYDETESDLDEDFDDDDDFEDDEDFDDDDDFEDDDDDDFGYDEEDEGDRY